jgi:hypothetical protein
MKTGRRMRLGASLFCFIVFAPMQLAFAQDVPTTGAWTIGTDRAGSSKVHFDVMISEPGGGHSSWGDDEDLDRFRGLSQSSLYSAGANVTFDLVRDAGTLHCSGRVASGSGGGSFQYVPNPAFPAQLARRGIARPDAQEQLRMTLSDVSLSFIDLLRGYHYAVSSPQELIRLSDHGVDSNYVSSLESAGYHVNSAEDLVRMVDHGVTRDYITSMRGLGYHPRADDLVRMVDHGVTPDFTRGMIALGYRPSVDQLVEMVDHGVTLDFVKHLRSRGYNANIDQLIRLRDAGI